VALPLFGLAPASSSLESVPTLSDAWIRVDQGNSHYRNVRVAEMFQACSPAPGASDKGATGSPSGERCLGERCLEPFRAGRPIAGDVRSSFGGSAPPSRTDPHTSLFYVRTLEKRRAHDGAFLRPFCTGRGGAEKSPSSLHRGRKLDRELFRDSGRNRGRQRSGAPVHAAGESPAD
jgi:hypothetical protein